MFIRWTVYVTVFLTICTLLLVSSETFTLPSAATLVTQPFKLRKLSCRVSSPQPQRPFSTPSLTSSQPCFYLKTSCWSLIKWLSNKSVFITSPPLKTTRLSPLCYTAWSLLLPSWITPCCPKWACSFDRSSNVSS